MIEEQFPKELENLIGDIDKLPYDYWNCGSKLCFKCDVSFDADKCREAQIKDVLLRAYKIGRNACEIERLKEKNVMLRNGLENPQFFNYTNYLLKV